MDAPCNVSFPAAQHGPRCSGDRPVAGRFVPRGHGARYGTGQQHSALTGFSTHCKILVHVFGCGLADTTKAAAMITEVRGNLLDADVDALVNTVNTAGVMGKGVALQFKQAFPANYQAYKRACERGEVVLGRMFVFDNGQLTRPRFIVNFPTKQHWRSRSRLSDIEAGVADLVGVIEGHGIRSIAIPALGCGNGGLDWADVEPRIEGALGAVPDVDVRLYPPQRAPAAGDMRISTERPRMTA